LQPTRLPLQLSTIDDELFPPILYVGTSGSSGGRRPSSFSSFNGTPAGVMIFAVT
jgi:hypothetical protein